MDMCLASSIMNAVAPSRMYPWISCIRLVPRSLRATYRLA